MVLTDGDDPCIDLVSLLVTKEGEAGKVRVATEGDEPRLTFGQPS